MGCDLPWFEVPPSPLHSGNIKIFKAILDLCNILLPQVESAAHAALMKALWADTAFLAGQGVMDYSLIVGVDSPNGALVVGIIDFLRQVCTIFFPPYPIPVAGNVQLLTHWSICALALLITTRHCAAAHT